MPLERDDIGVGVSMERFCTNFTSAAVAAMVGAHDDQDRNHHPRRAPRLSGTAGATRRPACCCCRRCTASTSTARPMRMRLPKQASRALIWEPFVGQPPADTREERAARLATADRRHVDAGDEVVARFHVRRACADARSAPPASASADATACFSRRATPHRGLPLLLSDHRNAAAARPGRGCRGARREHRLPRPHDPRRQGPSHQPRRVPATAGESAEPRGADDRRSSIPKATTASCSAAARPTKPRSGSRRRRRLRS